jgi:hypothetical protein
MRSLASGTVLMVLTASALAGQSTQLRAQSLLPPALMVAPIAPKIEPEVSTDGGKRANICTELVAFLEQKAAQGQAAPPPTSAQDASAPPRPPQQPGRSASVPPGASANTSPPVVDAPQHNSGLVAPIPPGGTGAKPPLVTLEQARTFAGANDVRACQQAVREMRRTGVAMPDGLIALAALSPEILEAQQGSR